MIVMGNSIANDPCYGGELFYGDLDRRLRALEVLRNMRKEGKHPLSKVPHIGDPELDNYTSNAPTVAVAVAPHIMGSDKSPGVCGEIEAVSGPVSKNQDVVTGARTSCTSTTIHTPPPLPLALTPGGEGEASINVIAKIEEIVNIELETVVVGAAEDKSIEEGISLIPATSTSGIEEETGRGVEVKVEVEVEVQGGTETDKEYLVRTCRYVFSLFSAFHDTARFFNQNVDDAFPSLLSVHESALVLPFHKVFLI